jgi:TolB-like protein
MSNSRHRARTVGHAFATTLLVLATAAGAGCRPQPTDRVAPDRPSEAEAAARRAVANERAINVASLPERSVGITPFAVNARDTTIAPLAYGLADILITDLQRSSQLQLVDRMRLDALLREVQLVEAGRVDPATAPRVGKLVGARRLVLGSLSERPGGQIVIDARIADVATGELRTGLSASAPLADILAAEKELAIRLLAQLGVNLSPAARARIEERQTRNIAALLAYSRAVRFEVTADYPSAAAQYRTALQLDPAFALAAEKLSQLPGESSTRRASLARATAMALERVNPVFWSPLAGGPKGGAGGIADPSFPSYTVIVLVTITTPP